MPARLGARTLSVNVETTLFDAIKVECHKPQFHGNHFEVVEFALRQYFDCQIQEAGLSFVHDHLAKMEAKLAKMLQEMIAALEATGQGLSGFARTMTEIQTSLRRVEQGQQKLERDQHALADSVQRLKTPVEPPKTGMFGRR